MTRGGRQEENDHDGNDDEVVSAGSSVVVTQAFVVTDTGMTVPRGTLCSVVEGVDERGNIHVKFPHRQPPWVALVGRLYATLAELQVMLFSFFLGGVMIFWVFGWRVILCFLVDR